MMGCNRFTAILIVFALTIIISATGCTSTQTDSPQNPAPSPSSLPPPTTLPDATAPATTPPAEIMPPAEIPSAAEKPTSFASEKYTHPSGLSIRYPKDWISDKLALPTVVFHAHDGVSPIHNFVIVDVRPATNFKDAAIASLNELIAADGFSATPTVESEKTVTLADGKTPATELILAADVLFKSRKGYVFGVMKDGQAYMVMAGVDPAKLDLFKEIVETLVFK